jgi:hypothetical protein
MISAATVCVHVEQAFSKLGVHANAAGGADGSSVDQSPTHYRWRAKHGLTTPFMANEPDRCHSALSGIFPGRVPAGTII